MLFTGSHYYLYLTIQVSALDQLACVHPDDDFWVKADASDVTNGLREYVGHVWSGDVGSGYGKVQSHHEEYMQRLEMIDKLSLHEKSSTMDNIQSIQHGLHDDLAVITPAV